MKRLQHKQNERYVIIFEEGTLKLTQAAFCGMTSTHAHTSIFHNAKNNHQQSDNKPQQRQTLKQALKRGN